MNEGQYDSKNVEHISIENIEVVSNGMDWKSRHLEAEKRKAEIRDRIHKQTEQDQKSAKDYFRPAKPTPSIYDSDLKRVAVYARVSTSSEEQISSIENQTLYYTKKIADYLCQHFAVCSKFYGLYDADCSTENHAPGTSHRCVL